MQPIEPLGKSTLLSGCLQVTICSLWTGCPCFYIPWSIAAATSTPLLLLGPSSLIIAAPVAARIRIAPLLRSGSTLATVSAPLLVRASSCILTHKNWVNHAPYSSTFEWNSCRLDMFAPSLIYECQSFKYYSDGKMNKSSQNIQSDHAGAP